MPLRLSAPFNHWPDPKSQVLEIEFQPRRAHPEIVFSLTTAILWIKSNKDTRVPDGRATNWLRQPSGTNQVPGGLFYSAIPRRRHLRELIFFGRPAMLIEKVGSRKVATIAEVREALKEASLDKGKLLLVHSPRGSQFIVLRKGAL